MSFYGFPFHLKPTQLFLTQKHFAGAKLFNLGVGVSDAFKSKNIWNLLVLLYALRYIIHKFIIRPKLSKLMFKYEQSQEQNVVWPDFRLFAIATSTLTLCTHTQLGIELININKRHFKYSCADENGQRCLQWGFTCRNDCMMMYVLVCV